MSGPKKLDPSSSPRALLGAELRHRREKAGLTQEELGARLFMSASYVCLLETGARRMRLEYAEKFDEILDTGGFFARNCEAVNKSRYPDHFAEAAEAEAVALAVRAYAPQLVPGLLQTRGYARAVFRAGRPTAPQEVIDELVAARLERAQLLDQPTEPLLWVVLDEGVLRRPVGGPAVMAEALRHVLRLAERHRVIVQVLPFSAGGHPALEGAVKLMEFGDAPPLAYLEGLGTGRLLDDPALVAHYRLTYDLVGAAALSPEASLALIASVAEEYGFEDQP